MSEKHSGTSVNTIRSHQHHVQSQLSDQSASDQSADDVSRIAFPQVFQKKTLLRQQSIVGNQSVQRWIALQRKPEHEAPLAAIQGHAMPKLLTALEALPADVRTDESAGAAVGGPRIVTAMRAVQAKGQPWITFVSAHNSELASLPPDQVTEIMHFLGASADARYYASSEFSGDFDGAVDPMEGVTVFLRVKVQLKEGARLGRAQPGTPQWEQETPKLLEQFKIDFKRVVEEAWSNKGTIKPAVPIGSVRALNTKLVVSVVESGEHTLFTLDSDRAEESKVAIGLHQGELHASDNQELEKTGKVADETGHYAGEVSTKQFASAHEAGHALRLPHVHCASNDPICYGIVVEERESVMGAGGQLKVIRRGGKVRHDDFQPFERVAERWGKDQLPGALAKNNKWSAG